MRGGGYLKSCVMINYACARPRPALHPSDHRPASPTLSWSEVEILDASLRAAMTHCCFGGMDLVYLAICVRIGSPFLPKAAV